jgi:lipoate-protein ligase A
MDIKRGVITQCSITGDFLGNTPIANIENILLGGLYERTALQQRLATLSMQDYLDNTDNETFINLLFNR